MQEDFTGLFSDTESYSSTDGELDLCQKSS